MALAVLNGTFRFPSDPEIEEYYSAEFRELVKDCLVTDQKERPDIHQVSFVEKGVVSYFLL